MKFKDGKFKILILSDVHTKDIMPRWTENFISYAMEKEKPDFVVLLGDNTAGYYEGVSKEKNITAIKKIVSLLGGTEFASVYGNHDHEGLPNMSEKQAKDFLTPVYMSQVGCLTKQGDYRLDIKDSAGTKNIFSLYFIDSGTYAKDGGYAKVSESQLENLKSMIEQNGKLPSYLFQHIIVPEIYDIMDESLLPKKGYTRGQCIHKNRYYKFRDGVLLSGSLREGPCPPDTPSNEFAAIKEQGNILACFFGHDHVNDFVADCEGVKLVAAPSPSFYTYGNNRGVRVVTIHEDDLNRLYTRVIYYDDVMKEKPKNPFIYRWGIQKYERVFRRKFNESDSSN